MTFYETIKTLEGKTIKEVYMYKNGDFKTISIETDGGDVFTIIAAVSKPLNSPALRISLNGSSPKP